MSDEELTELIKQFCDELDNPTMSEEIHPGAKMPPEEREASMIADGNESLITDGLRDIWKKECEKYKDMVQEKVSL